MLRWSLANIMIGGNAWSPPIWRHQLRRVIIRRYAPRSHPSQFTAYTGGEPLFTHWAHGEYMVGSETKYPAWAHQVHVDYFLITFTIYPPKYPPGTC